MSGPGPGLRFSAAAATDVGLVREGNEDSYYQGTTVFAVADGMGGHVAGEIASSTALEPIASVNNTQFATGEDAQEALVEAITAANADVIAQGDADPSLSGMGTTLTAVLIRAGRLHVAHVGDSRAYLLRESEAITQLTTDHTLVEQLVRDGRISREQAAIHPQRSVVTRAIGVDRKVEVDSLLPLELQPGDQVLLCSDGLTGPVSDERIAAILVELGDADAACRALIEAAHAGGAPDNVTVILLRVEGSNGTRSAEPPPDVDGDSNTGPLPPPAPAAVPLRTAEGATPINTRSESDPSTSWAERMGRYGEAQGADSGSTPSQLSRSGRAGRGGGGLSSGGMKRAVAALLAVVLLLGLIAGGAYALLSRTYYVGDDDGSVAIFNGLPQSFVGLPLYWVRETSDLATDDLPAIQAGRVREGVTAADLTEARETVERFRERAADAQQRQNSPADTTGDDATADPGSTPGTADDPAADAAASAP